MFKFQLVFLFILGSLHSAVAQEKYTLLFNHHTTLFHQYNPLMRKFLKNEMKSAAVSSYNVSFDRNFKLRNNQSFTISASFLKRKLRLKQSKIAIIESFTTIIEKRVVDEVRVNRACGLGIGYQKSWFIKKYYSVISGATGTSYFLNRDTGKLTYENSNFTFNKRKSKSNFEDMLTYSANLEIYTKLMFNLPESKTLGIRLTLGTSVYSNWDNFAKYLWLGTGIEYGFGKPREKKVK